MAKLRFDWQLILPAILLTVTSLAILQSVAPQLVTNQLIFLAVAVGAFLIFNFIHHEIVFSLHFLSYFLGLSLSLLTIFFGVFSRGSQRWLQIGQFTLQPSELIKPFLLITFSTLAASSLSHKKLWLFILGIIPMII